MPSPALLCRAALQQADAKWPSRNRASDGIMSSDYHKKQNPYSDHDWGNAWDLTHDPENGCDAHAYAIWLAEQNWPEVKYIISNGRIWSTLRRNEGWRDYKGPNPHTKHIHISINERYRNTIRTWYPATAVSNPTPVVTFVELGDVVAVLPVLRKSDTHGGQHVRNLQALLIAHGYELEAKDVDGYFGNATEHYVKRLQGRHSLEVDGIVGKDTWKALLTI